MKIPEQVHKAKIQTLEAMRRDRLPWWNLWRELADFYLPRRYAWLLSPTESAKGPPRSKFILNGTGTNAARTLAAGMMNGITSPSRPWFKLRIAGIDEEAGSAARIWLDECERRIMALLAESNFYNAMAIVYLDLAVFNTAAMLIYEDDDSVIRCYNPALGEFYLAQDHRLQVNTFAREFTYTVRQVVSRWGLENCSDRVKAAWNAGGSRLQEQVQIVHLIEPNDKQPGQQPPRFKFREYYWEKSETTGTVLEVRGYREAPGIFPRWELVGNDVYGTGPSLDALGDVIQLQHETKKKAQGLDKMISPPLVADVQLQHRPLALLPNGITFVSGANNVGIKPVYQVAPPINELTMDIREIEARIRETFHNDLFKMISQLDTVRSATEIDARREEKLVLLGSVLDRFESEALDPALKRIFAIAARRGILPEAPEEIAGRELEIQYVSILTTAQRAVGVVPVERWLAIVGQTLAVYPNAANIVNWDETLRFYGTEIGVPAKVMRSRDEVAQADAQAQELAEQREAAATGEVLVDSAKTLSETDVGGGMNALQMMLE